MNDYPSDIPKIQDVIKSKHQKFMEQYGNQIDKVLADHRLLSDIAAAKIFRIGVCFKEEGIVDPTMEANGPCKVICLSKHGHDAYVNVSTNGTIIMVEGHSYSSGMADDYRIHPKKKYYDVDKDDFDWVKFSTELLDYVHATIYERQEACDTKIKDLFVNTEGK